MTGFDLQGIGEHLQRARVEGLAKPMQGPQEPSLPQVGAGDVEPSAFAQALESAIDNVDGLSRDVGDKVQSLASGEPVALHDIMMAMGKSEVSFNLMLEVRNKLVEAWEKLSRSVV